MKSKIPFIIGCFLLPFVSYGALTDDLLSYWAFDESSGNALDSTVTNNDLVNNNSITYVTGLLGNSADLESSSSQYFSIADGSQSGLDAGTKYTWSFWLNIETSLSSGNLYTIFQKDTYPSQRSYSIYYNNDSGTMRLSPYIFGNNDTAYSRTFNNADLSTGVWKHVVITFDGTQGSATSKIKVYINM